MRGFRRGLRIKGFFYSTRWAFILLFVAALVAAVWGGFLVVGSLSSGDPVVPAADKTDKGTPDQDLINALKNAAAHPAPCTTLVDASQVTQKGSVIATDSLQSWNASVADGKRYSGDSLSTPFPATDDGVAAFHYWEQLVCTQPFVGASTGSMLANTPLGDGQTIGQITGIGPVNATDIKPMVTMAYDTTPKSWAVYQDYAAKVNALLNVAQIAGVQKNPESIHYWHFANGGFPESDGYPSVEMAGTENLSALELRYLNKGETCELARVGINVVGPMPEIFKPEGCSAPSTPSLTTPNETGKSGCTANDCSSPSCATGCGTGPGCTTSCATTTNPPCQGGSCTTTTNTPPPTTTCNCGSKTSATQPVPTPAPTTRPVPTTAPPVRTTASSPIVTGPPTTVDTTTHNTPIPTPTGGPFG